MLFRIKTVDATPQSVDLGCDFFRDVVIDCCVNVEGFLGAWFLVDRENSRTVTLSAWTGEEALSIALAALGERIASDPQVARAVETINAGGVRFETFDVADSIAPSSEDGERTEMPLGLRLLFSRPARGSRDLR